MKSIAKSLLPDLYKVYRQYRDYAYFKERERARLESERQQHRRDIVRFSLSKNTYFEVYWKIYGIGRGPALALYIDEEEILKFDCYGCRKGHYHIQVLQPGPCRHPALLMPEKSKAEQIDRAIFEIENNLYWYLERHPSSMVRNSRFSRSKLLEILSQVKPILLSYAELSGATETEASDSLMKYDDK